MKNKYILLIMCAVAVLIYFINIKVDDAAKPETYLNEKEMTAILVDIHITDAVLEVRKLKDGDSKMKNYSYYNYIFKKHNITRVIFDKNIEYYSCNETRFNRLYAKVNDIMSEQQNELLAEDEKMEKKLEDDTKKTKTEIEKSEEVVNDSIER